MSDDIGADSPNGRFLNDALPGGEKTFIHRTVYALRAGAASAAAHVAVVLLLMLIASRVPQVPNAAKQLRQDPNDVVWLTDPGPVGRGGGGGGNERSEPPRKFELPGKEQVTVPVVKPSKPAPEIPKETPTPEQQIVIPALAMASGLQELPGTLTVMPSGAPSQGSGSGGGAGTGSGTGIGPGAGPGLGPGKGRGSGGGPFLPGDGVERPRLIREVKPNYTGDAMRAKIQGVVTMEAVVNPNGSVGNVVVTKSLDPTFGLDQEAIRTVRQWRFAPGTRFGEPVPVVVEIEMTFRLH